MDLRDFLFKEINGGMEKSINQLSFDHLDVLLSIWHINRIVPGNSQRETELAKAFNGEKQHKYDEHCVQDLFQWNILKWIKEGETFRINPSLDGSFQEISEAWIQLKS